MKRYHALDSWRGICACIVVLLHVETYNHFYVPLHDSAYLCVDFFFILSGFVITGKYADRLQNGMPVKDFLFLRIGRLYGLYILMLFAWAGLYFVKGMLKHWDLADTGDSYTLTSFIANIFLIQSLGLFHSLTWNGPSWSISVEFYTYVLFAVALVLSKRHLWKLQLAVIVVAPIIIAQIPEHGMNTNYDWGFLRCVYGFSMGSLGYRLHKRYANLAVLQNIKLMNVIEIMSVIAALGFAVLVKGGPLSVLAPYIFCFVILIFAEEKGIVSAGLKTRFLLFLGTASYSIYMVHYIMVETLYDIAGMLEKHWKSPLYTNLPYDGGIQRVVGTHMWQGDIMMFAILVMAIVASYFTYKWVELPTHNWAKRIVARDLGKTEFRPDPSIAYSQK